VLLWLMARKVRTTHYVNDSGARVAEDGSALQYMMMGNMVGTFDDNDDGDDAGDDDAGDYDGDFD